ncbi:MAG: ABC transporter ATP-binding protein [Anaerolineaceae bacterium]|nr:ABC transporter ATP-binding protein [Anaerolineaceae bacterium]
MAPKLSIQNASFGYNGNDLVWKDINIDVQERDCLCMLGPNGSGKTTLLNCINGTFPLRSGCITINGKDIKSYSIVELARTIGIVFQEHSAPFPYSSLEVVRMGRTPYLGMFETPSRQDTELAYGIMKDLGIAHLASKSYTHISGGERQMVLIARTLCQEPEIILFDEPTSHLDFKNQAMVLRTIKKLSQNGMTIVMTSHFPNHVWKIGTHVAMLGFNGMVAQGRVDAVMTEEYLTETYSVDVKIFEAGSETAKTRYCEPAFE